MTVVVDQPLSDAAAGFAKEQLKSFIERIERLEEEKKTIADDIKDVFAEAKGSGFDVKALRDILKIRKQDADERAEHEAIVDLYMQALGMLPFEDTDLGRAAAGN
ncbi:MAG: hypothetical protein DI549_18935 [Ancylobacter novellus]|uniref:UPF0335 protein DI549_18935 n=1 Tax=Ancylobacter novellus TaxID=921 RepID=A0A2W5SAU1_ANCNO|nr:MAG: hypothetical protein DI549_18935 [Ancylobacter novellus]